jgi:cohesin loading factor subunit SCC2
VPYSTLTASIPYRIHLLTLQVRAKAVKALAGVVEVDTNVLHYAAVRGCLQTALLDESISVREAAIELLGRYLTTNPALAEEFFDVIASASNVGL